MKPHHFLLLTHVFNAHIEALIARARRELAADHEIHVLGFFPDDACVPCALTSLPEFLAVRHADVLHLGYPKHGRGRSYGYVPGNTDIPVLFWWNRLKRPSGYIWLFEGDVEFTGSLRTLIDHHAALDHDLLCTNVRTMRHNWEHRWRSHVPPDWRLPKDGDRIALLPAFRASGSLLGEIDLFYREGGDGHHEWSWPYIAEQTSMKLADFRDFPMNGRPIYTSTPSVRGLFPGTFRYRPVMNRAGRRPNTLYHPVKDVRLNWRESAALNLSGLAAAGRSLLENLAHRYSR